MLNKYNSEVLNCKAGADLLKKFFSLFLVSVICFVNSVYAAEPAGGYARAAIVIDGGTGKVLYEKNIYEKLGMASTTKIMTALCGIEFGNLKGEVKVSNRAAAVEGSSMYLKAGEKISLYNIITGLMLVSGNDAATAIAENVAGSEGGFVLLMNQKANEIGAYNTCFQNPHGLSNPTHYTTAYDLARITAYAMKNPIFAEIVSQKSKTVESISGDKRTLVNHNKLLRIYDGCIGVKTGFTKATGRCLVSAARRDGLLLICVTLNDGNDWNDHMMMLDKGFSNHRVQPLIKKGVVLAKAKVSGGTERNVELIAENDESVAVKKGENPKLSISVKENISLEAPIKKGNVYLKADVLENGEKVGEINLVAAKDVGLKEKRQDKDEKRFFDWLFKKNKGSS